MTEPEHDDHRFVGYFDTNYRRTQCRYCDRPEKEHRPVTMRTAYIGPLPSVNEATDRVVKSELRVEPADPAYGEKLAVGIYGYNSGSEIRTALLTAEQAAELRDALQEYLDARKAES